MEQDTANVLLKVSHDIANAIPVTPACELRTVRPLAYNAVKTNMGLK